MRKLYANQGIKNGELMIRNLFNFFQNEGSFTSLFIYDFYWILISDVQLRAIFEAYGKFSEHDIEEDIQSETSGTFRKGLLAVGRKDIKYQSFKFT